MCAKTIDPEPVALNRRLIESLLQANAYPHPVDNLRLVETHISWVILTGEYAYKIKKPLKLEFLDYSTLVRRKHFCDEELRLNRHWAPQLYLGVVPIAGTHENPLVSGSGDPIEFAVKMRQFPQAARLDAQLDAGTLTNADMIAFAEYLARRHTSADVCTDMSAKQAYESIRHPMQENVRHLRTLMSHGQLRGLASWTGDNLEALRPTIISRQRNGFVRECHGDLKLANLLRLDSEISAFDCVEFSAELRNIDVISDVSFLMMDLAARQRPDLAYVLLNRYLECTGDYAGLTVLGLYFVYHALIRAKIAAIRSAERDTKADRQDDLDELKSYCSVARRWIDRPGPALVLMHGFSASGKTWLSEQLLASLPGVRLRSDIERKRRYGLLESEASDAGVAAGIYAADAKREIYARLADIAESVLRCGQHVIVDASFLLRSERQRFQTMAMKLDVPLLIVDCRADHEELLIRLTQRTRETGNASEANADVLQNQYEHSDALDHAEKERTLSVTSHGEVDVNGIVEWIIGNADAVRRAD